MKLQFAFGNPRKKRKSRKSVAKRRKSSKIRHKRPKKSSIAAKLSKAKKHMAGKKRRSSKRLKNPEFYVARKGGKVVGRGRTVANDREARNAKAAVELIQKKISNAPMGAARTKLRKQWLQAKKALASREAELKTASRYAEEGAEIKTYQKRPKGGAVAKKRRKKKKSSAKKHSKAKVKRHKKRRKSGKRKSSKRRRKAKKVAAAIVAAPKKRRHKRRKSKKAKGTKRRKKHSKRKVGGKRRRRARRVSHSHSSNVRHLKKGSRVRFKGSSGKGKRRVKVSGSFKINPRRRNPMANVSAQTKKFMGLDANELASLAIGGALVPIVNAGIGAIPGMSTLVATINSYLGPQATGSVIPILVGVGLNVAGDAAGGQAGTYLELAGEGLCAAGVIGLIMGLSQQYVLPAVGLSGVNYTPNMRGINYTPAMSGINYTPAMGIMPQLNGGMGIMPQMNGPDFGAMDYGGGGGYTESNRFSSSDFGYEAGSDNDVDEMCTDDDISTDNMSGGLG